MWNRTDRTDRTAEPRIISLATVKLLTGLEYDIVRLHGNLGDVVKVLRTAGEELPRCRIAAKQLRAIRRMVGRVLEDLDEDITDAVQALEMIDPPPF